MKGPLSLTLSPSRGAGIHVLVLLLTLTGCSRGLAEREAELAATIRDESLLAAQLNQLTRQLSALQTANLAEQGRTRRSTSALRDAQISAVELWRGEAPALEEKKKAHPLPKNLVAALDLAQSVAGGESLEKRFVRAAAANDGPALAGIVDAWEFTWLDLHDPEPEDEPAKVCPTTRSLACTAIDDDSLWCPDAEQQAAWAMLLDNGLLTVARLQAGTSHTVEARLAPRVWLTRLGSGDTGALFLHTVRGSTFVTQWTAKLQKGEVRLEQLKANFDEDVFTEGLFWSADELLYADPTSRDDVTLLRDVPACEALALLEGVPAPVRERCRQLTAPPPPPPDAGTP